MLFCFVFYFLNTPGGSESGSPRIEYRREKQDHLSSSWDWHVATIKLTCFDSDKTQTVPVNIKWNWFWGSVCMLVRVAGHCFCMGGGGQRQRTYSLGCSRGCPQPAVQLWSLAGKARLYNSFQGCALESDSSGSNPSVWRLIFFQLTLAHCLTHRCLWQE